MNKNQRPALEAAIVTVTPLQQNCSIFFNPTSKSATVVDPGGDVPLIVKAIDELDVEVQNIVLTHGHIDHAGGVVDLIAALDRKAIKIEGPHKDDLFLLQRLETDGPLFGINNAKNFAPDRLISEGDNVSIAGFEFTTLHCPGHTPGSLVYFNNEHKIALMGDVLFRDSIGRTDFAYGSHEQLMNSIETKILPLNDEISFICGHGPHSTIGRERAFNSFLKVRP